MLQSISRLLRHSIKIRYRSLSTAAAIPTSTMAASSANPNAKPQKFDYLLVLDFEATCDQGFNQPIPQEIIEFPCMKINTSTWEIESQFHQYVRPVANPVLTSFCTQLTGIVQDMVDDQPTLEETLKLFDDWLRSEGLSIDQKSTDQISTDQISIDQKSTDGHPADHGIDSRTARSSADQSIDQISDRLSTDQSIDAKSSSWTFVTCGDWDLKSMLRNQCDHFGYHRPDYFRRWINIKKIYFQQTKQFPKGMMQMLDQLNLVHEGKHHSGIDDVRNIVQIVRVLGLRGVTYDLTSFEK